MHCPQFLHDPSFGMFNQRYGLLGSIYCKWHKVHQSKGSYPSSPQRSSTRTIFEFHKEILENHVGLQENMFQKKKMKLLVLTLLCSDFLATPLSPWSSLVVSMPFWKISQQSMLRAQRASVAVEAGLAQTRLAPEVVCLILLLRNWWCASLCCFYSLDWKMKGQTEDM